MKKYILIKNIKVCVLQFINTVQYIDKTKFSFIANWRWYKLKTKPIYWTLSINDSVLRDFWQVLILLAPPSRHYSQFVLMVKKLFLIINNNNSVLYHMNNWYSAYLE